MPRIPLLLLAGAMAIGPLDADAGSFIPLDGVAPATVIHPTGYQARGGVLPIRVCLRPDARPAAGNPQMAMRNAVATFNRLAAVVGNVEVTASNTIDFESMLVHELGHCLGLGHSALGPSERAAFGAPEAALFHANSLPGPNGLLQAFPGLDGVRGTHDDQRGDDRNLSWFQRGLNDPFVLPPTRVDRGTYSSALADLPPGHLYPEIASAFDPCVAAGRESIETNASMLRERPRTQSVMYPVLCQPHRLRQLAPEDVALLRIARAGADGLQDSSDDHRPRLTLHDGVDDCEIDLRFATGEGFAFCTVETEALPGGDRVIRRATATFDRQVSWLFNSEDRSGLGAPQDLSLATAAPPVEAAPGEPLRVTLQLGVPAPGPARDLVIAGSSAGHLVLEGVDGAACDSLPCALGEQPTGARTVTLHYRVAGDAPPDTLLSARWILSADSHDPDGSNNIATITIPLIDRERILRSGFEDGETAPGG